MLYTLNGVTTTYYFHRNLLGDVISIYDTSGNEVVRYAYDAWGNCTITSDTTKYDVATANPIRYRGYYYDADTNLYYLNARYYSPELRRFISPDDTAYLDPETPNGLNLYCYCNNDPVNYADPSGRSAVMVTIAIIGISALIGTTIGAVSSGLAYAATAGDSYSTQGLIGAIAGGAVSGFITGFAAGAMSLPGMNLAAGAVVGIGALVGFGAGLVGSLTNDFVASGFDVNVLVESNTWLNAVTSGIYGAVFGAIGGLVTGPISNPSLAGLTGAALQKATAKLWGGFVRGIPMDIVCDSMLEFTRWYSELYTKYYVEQFKKIPA